jgi:L-amino acid N-acyltransferase YncA
MAVSASKSNVVLLRRICAEDACAIRALSGASDITRTIVAPRYGSLDQLLCELNDAAKHLSSSVLYDNDSTGQLLGWACSLRFHERAGYSGTAHFVMDAAERPDWQQPAAVLLEECERQGRAAGVHTLISFVTTETPQRVLWHRVSGFEHCGLISIRRRHEMHVFCRRLAP